MVWNLRMQMTHEVKLERACRLCRRNRRGAAAVEFALVGSVFVIIVFGMIEIGRVLMVQQILTNAAREGVRVAILDAPSSTATQVNTTVTTYLQNAGITGATITINPTNPTAATYGTAITVTVQVPFSSVSWLPSFMFVRANAKVAASAVMRRETVQ
jgi:Flp pilus assembly protein TadG